ncbi:MAG: thioredoxin family protein [Chlorobi bacterium]|nr:thioredoxin family protein [Chlorobiota bacterium]
MGKQLRSFLIVALLATVAIAREHPATWSLVSTNYTAALGDTLILIVEVGIEKGWYTYGINEYLTADGVGPQRTEFSLSSPSLKILHGQIRISPSPRVEYDSSFEISVEKIKGKARFTIPVFVGKLSPGTHRDTLRIYHQLCTAQNCLPPEESILPVTFEILATSPTTKYPATASTSVQSSELITAPSAPPASSLPAQQGTATGTPSDSPSSSWWGLLAMAAVLGVGSWFMPCVYPMIPITVSYFTKRAEKEHTRPLLDSVVYSVGIMSTFLVFGAVAALFFGATAGRDIATNPWLNFFLAILFLVIAGNLFGMYELRLPSRWVNALNRESSRVIGYRSSFLMGMVFSLTSFTCTVPFVDIIGKMAAGGEWFRPIVAMSFYAAIFAVPFFLLALFPTFIQRMPRSGIWMNHLKVSFAFIEIAFAVSYLARVDSIVGWQLLSRELVLAIWASCALLIAVYVLGVFRTKLDTPLEYVGGVRASVATLFLALMLYFVQGMFGGSVGPFEAFVYVESARPTTGTAQHAESNVQSTMGRWFEDLDSARAAAQKLGMPIFIDFTGVSCTNCRWMEKNMFTQSPVQQLMQKMILVRAFTDRRNNPRDAFYKQYQQSKFGSTLLPFYALLNPDGSLIGTATYTSNSNEFIAFLQRGISSTRRERTAITP